MASFAVPQDDLVQESGVHCGGSQELAEVVFFLQL